MLFEAILFILLIKCRKVNRESKKQQQGINFIRTGWDNFRIHVKTLRLCSNRTSSEINRSNLPNYTVKWGVGGGGVHRYNCQFHFTLMENNRLKATVTKLSWFIFSKRALRTKEVCLHKFKEYNLCSDHRFTFSVSTMKEAIEKAKLQRNC